jgi:23S rRNA pseudouridine2605 synthase
VLLLTTDGDAANRLTHPRAGIERVYVATVTGDAKTAAERARRGVTLEDGPVHPKRVSVRPLRDGRWDFEVVISEGRKREVRRLCSEVGLRVERLVRTTFGPVQLGDLPVGTSRPLSAYEKGEIERITKG